MKTDNPETKKKSDKVKQNKVKIPKFLKHSVLVEQDLMTSHEYERIYYKPSLV
jgi:hypothetical protein